MRAREPDSCGYVVRRGVRLYFEVFGDGPTTILLLPAWAIVHSQMWKLQVPYLARHFRVVTFDPRGNGKSDRPPDPQDYADAELVADALAVLDATGTAAAVCVGLSKGAGVLLRLAAVHPERVTAAVFVAPTVGLGEAPSARSVYPFEEELDTDRGWAKFNAHYWRRNYPGFARFFLGQIFVEAHSSKQIEDGVGWALETDPQTLIATQRAPYLENAPAPARPVAAELAARVTCPCLVMHGDEDRIVGLATGLALAETLGCGVELFQGGGHCVQARHPVRFNLVLRRFVESVVPVWAAPAVPAVPARKVAAVPAPSVPRTIALAVRARTQAPRAVGLLADRPRATSCATWPSPGSLREQVPDLEIQWWAQPPVTAVLEAAGEIVHPASAELASESAHWESESAHHDLHAFYAFRRMDEIFCANYMLFDDVVRETPYDLWVGDESWEVDHFLHENPERKIAPYAFLTDVIGFLPVDPRRRPARGRAVRRLQRRDDRTPGPVSRTSGTARCSSAGSTSCPTRRSGPGLPRVRDWSAQWFTSVPYVVPVRPGGVPPTRPHCATELGYGTGFPLYVAAVGGTDRRARPARADGRGVRAGAPAAARCPHGDGHRSAPAPGRAARRRGAWRSAATCPTLFEHLACADVAVVQGGLSTTMELVAARRPFIYFPLAHHWEQQHFVAHRLDHYRRR